jgi:hypothetical protein
LEELKPTLSYNEWQKISIQKEVKLLCQRFGYEFSQSKLDELFEIYKDETEGVYEFCCMINFTNCIGNYKNGILPLDLISARLNYELPCKLGSDVLLYLYTQIANEVGWNKELVHCYNVGMKYTLPF